MQGLPDGSDHSFQNPFSSLTTAKAITIIIALGIIVYFNTVFNGFVWDDITYLIFNSDVHTFSFGKIFGPSLFNDGVFYRPLVSFYFAFFYPLFGNVSFFYHSLGIIIHIINTSLIFYLFNRFFNLKNSLFLSLLFLIHPIQVESVAYISSVGNLLFLLLGMIALSLSLEKSISNRKLALIFILIFLSVLAKETGIIFVFIIIAYRFIFDKSKKISFLVIGGLLPLLYIFIRYFALGVIHIASNVNPISELPLSTRLINIPSIFYYYLKTTFLPFNLVIDQQWVVTKTDYISFYFPLILGILLLVLFYIFGKHLYKHKNKTFQTFIFFSLWFICGISLHLQIIPLEMTVADRWFYFPFVGLLGVIGCVLTTINFSSLKKRQILNLVGILLIILFSLRTIIRNSDWYNGMTLFSHDSNVLDNADIEDNLANQYASLKNFDEAKQHWNISLAMRPSETTYYNVAYGYEEAGNTVMAERSYYKALDSRLYYTTSHKHLLNTYYRLGKILITTNKHEEAKRLLSDGVKDYPDSGDLWYLFAINEYQINNQTAAMSAIVKAKLYSGGNQFDEIYNQIFQHQKLQLPVEDISF